MTLLMMEIQVTIFQITLLKTSLNSAVILVNPDGIESGDDEAGCCHWSKESAAGS